MNKRYTANNRQSLILILILPTSGQMSIEFKHGYSIHNEAYFLTNDATVQEALEKDQRFGKSYRLSEIDGMDVAEYNSRKDMKEAGVSDGESNELTPLSFPNAQTAKEWLHKDHSVPLALLTNKGKTYEKAKELGFEITFENDNK